MMKRDYGLSVSPMITPEQATFSASFGDGRRAPRALAYQPIPRSQTSDLDHLAKSSSLIRSVKEEISQHPPQPFPSSFS